MKYLIFLLTGLLLSSCSEKKQEQPAQDNRYAVITVASTTANLSTSYPAVIKGVQDVEIRSKVTGNIIKQLVDEGAYVEAGQVLFVIDPTQYRSAVQQAQAAVDVARASIATQQLAVQNKSLLREKDIISQYELDVAKNQLNLLKAQLAQAEAVLVNAKDQLSFCQVRATSSGVVGSIPYRVGALINSASSQPLTIVSNLSKMHAYFSMSEKQLLEMTRTSGGTEVALKALPEVELLLADGTFFNLKGIVNSVSGIIDASTGSVQMRATFDNPENVLRSGATGTIRFPVRKMKSIVIPQGATYALQDKKFVYLVDKNNVVHSTEIAVLPQHDGQNYVVTDGLKVGDRIVVEGVSKLKNETAITPITPEESKKQLRKSEQHMADKKMPGQE